MARDGRTIRWGIAGTGHIASRFAADIAHAPGAELTGVASRDHAKAGQFASRHLGVTAYASLAEIASSAGIDAIYIASPNTAHLGQALQCVAGGKAVLVEKPVMASCEEARTLRDAAGAARVFAMEAVWSRYLPAVRAAREVVTSGKLGHIRRLDAELAWKVPYDPASRLFDPAAGGGALLDLGVYPVSLARFLLGEPDRHSGRWRAAESGVDMAAEVELHFGDVPAKLACGFDRDGDNRLIIEGDEATLVLGLPFIGAKHLGLFRSRSLADRLFPGGRGRRASLMRRAARLVTLPGAAIKSFPYPGTGLQFEIEAASNAIRNGDLSEADCTLDDSLRTLAIIDSVGATKPVSM